MRFVVWGVLGLSVMGGVAIAAPDDIASLADDVCKRRTTIEKEIVEAVQNADQAKVDAQAAVDDAKTALDALRRQRAPQRDAVEALESTLRDATKAFKTAEKRAKSAHEQQQKRTAAFGSLCTQDWSKLIGRDYPALYVEAKVPGVCANTGIAGGSDVEGTAQAYCSRSTPKSAFTSVAINVVLGLGDLLQARAKQEVLEYLLERLAKKFCAYKNSTGEIDLAKLFETTCKKLLPAGTDKPVDVDPDAFNFGEIRDAFIADLRQLPTKLSPIAMTWIKKKWPNADPYLAAAGVLFAVAMDLREHKSPLEILEHIGELADANTTHVKCDFAKLEDTNRNACVALLLFQVGRTAAAMYDDPLPKPATVLDAALADFCAVHGVTGMTTDGKCVIDPSTYEKWHTRLLEMYGAAKRFLELHKSLVELAKTTLPDELGKRAGPEIISALRALLVAHTKVLVEVSPVDKVKLEEARAFVDLVLESYRAIKGGDPAALRTALMGMLAMLGDRVSAKASLAITTMISLGTAKDRAEVKTILDDVTAKVGTHKSKYNADHTVVMINGYVGMFFGGELRRLQRDMAGTRIDAETEYAPVKLVAPLGLDVTVCSYRKKHVGLFFSVIDPLALDVRETDGKLTADWETLFVPGMHVRFGLAGPITASFGAQYSFGRRSDDLCGDKRCFDGALQAGVWISADVSLFELNP